MEANVDEPVASSSFADNECAMALLDLSESVSPPPNDCVQPKSADLFAPDSLFSISSALYLNGTKNKSKKGRDIKQGATGKSSILKRQLEHGNKSKFTEHFDPQIAVKIECQSGEELRLELVKRIRLDHNYPCAGDFSWNKYVKALSHPSGEVNNKPPPPKGDGKFKKDSNQGSGWGGSANKGKKSSPDNKTGSSKSPNHRASSMSPKGKKDVFSPKGSSRDNNMMVNNNPPVDHPSIKTEDTQSTKSFASAPYLGNNLQTEKENLAEDDTNVQDLYQPNDSKYKNFNLLLKCLTADDIVEDKPSTPGSCDTGHSDTTKDASGCSDDLDDQNLGINTNGDTGEYPCISCSRVFLQKRYLTKHMRRMHPEILGMDAKKEDDLVVCPSCGESVLRKSFKQHSNMCTLHTKKSKKQLEMDLANCQFCGIRMRRHILVRHLAQEHCVENLRDASLYMFDEVGSDSSTLSGSEHHSDAEDFGGDYEEGQLVEGCSYPIKDGPASWRSDLSPLQTTAEIATHQASNTTPQLPKSRTSNPASVPPNPNYTQVTCQLCGLNIHSANLSAHLKTGHGIDTSKNALDINQSSPQLSGCSHSMLQRFLSEDTSAVSHDQSKKQNEECHSCVQRLVSGASNEDDGYVSSNNNYTLRTTQSTTAPTGSKIITVSKAPSNATYTIFISKDSRVVGPHPQGIDSTLSSPRKQLLKAQSLV